MRYRIALVEYLNTLPFYEGMRLTGLDHEVELHKVVPSVCAQLFKHHEVDISLCPVGALEDMPEHALVGKYCIGADGPVGTVMLLSKVPLGEIKTVQLDPHSRTSNMLVRILAKRWWKKEWQYIEKENGIVPDAHVMIGDKVFEAKPNYPFQFDLSEAWKALTGLPMVFAVWIARPEVPPSIIDRIDLAFETGMAYVDHQQHHLKEWQVDYLHHAISYSLDEEKKKALALFRAWKQSLHPVHLPD